MGDTPRLPLSEFCKQFDVSWRRDSLGSVNSNHAIVLGSGEVVVYDKLVVAIGAPREAVYPHATTFRGADDTETVHGLVQDVEMGNLRSIGFVVPSGAAWSLPMYELALMTARRAYEMNI